MGAILSRRRRTTWSGAQLIGFYSYGEIAPVAGSPCELHNQTMTVTTISESSA